MKELNTTQNLIRTNNAIFSSCMMKPSYSKLDKCQDFNFCILSILVVEYPNSVTDTSIYLRDRFCLHSFLNFFLKLEILLNNPKL